MPILDVRNIRKRFDERYSLHDIGFELTRGEVLCFLGPSGCGKTTLLRIIAGLEAADSGEVFFDGRPLAGIPPHRRGFGMMFQEYALFPHLSVAANVAFGLRMLKMSDARIRSRTDEILELVGLTGFGPRNVDDLSGGERQRVALARSLAPQPRLLMLDEPLAALDRALRERLANDLRSILKTVGVTAIFVTHDQSEAFAIADRIAVFDDGRLLQLDTPEAVYTCPANATVAAFLGFRNILPAHPLADGSVQTPVGVTPAAMAATVPGHPQIDASRLHQRPLSLLIRPEGARLADARESAADTIVIEGHVTTRTFLGHGVQLGISCAGKTALRFLLPLSPPPPASGPVRIAIPTSSLVFLHG
ncbi:ABC-type Fe3+/spermidine/putrescine transport system ATPase subunit [Desulfobaculum xiamenense]|uniref:ABC-type Fe3+/spermidine/putrescine transport system ATPase subunit n=1 Tax=Desulfobaculum xiamenense TaxID=995050 RepID=A0A846QMK6_9BACT|nr:ABC transporter ATP-binding protein [Desulfobaculum xiamenense]NJB66484.1 ABC-type Fe3+/spermidine/putrescine transport system ATPase subunit [Desulfobaculum xiamenense]